MNWRTMIIIAIASIIVFAIILLDNFIIVHDEHPLSDKFVKKYDWAEGEIACMRNKVPILVKIGNTNTPSPSLELLPKGNSMRGITSCKHSPISSTGKNRVSVYRDEYWSINYYYIGHQIIGVYGVGNGIAAILNYNNNNSNMILRSGNKFNYSLYTMLSNIRQIPAEYVEILEYLPGGAEGKRPYTLFYDEYHLLCYGKRYVLYIGIAAERDTNREPQTVSSIGLFDRQYIDNIDFVRALRNNSVEILQLNSLVSIR